MPISLRAGETERLQLPGLALAYSSYLTRHLEPPHEPFSSEHPSLVWDALFERARVFASPYRQEDNCELCPYPVIAGNRVSFLKYFELIEEPSDDTTSIFSAHPELSSTIQEASLWHLRLSTAAVDDQTLVPPLLIPIPIEISGVYGVSE